LFPDEDVPLGTLQFLGVTLLAFLPWSLATPWAVARALRRPWEDVTARLWVLIALWPIVVIGFFALSPFKLPHYGLPALPALALPAGPAHLHRQLRRRRARARVGRLAPATRPRCVGGGRGHAGVPAGGGRRHGALRAQPFGAPGDGGARAASEAGRSGRARRAARARRLGAAGARASRDDRERAG